MYREDPQVHINLQSNTGAASNPQEEGNLIVRNALLGITANENLKIQLGSPKGMRSVFQVSTPYRDKKSHLWQHIQEGFICLFVSK